MSEQANGLRELVRERYAAAATLAATGAPPSCCDSTGQAVEVGEGFGADLYAETERGELPAETLASSLGCGNPLAVAELQNGETVLDLGSGGGIDVLLSARRVGPTGKAYGLDMTTEMIQLARANAARAGATNVEFLQGTIEAVPLPDASVDVVISNCVINLSTDKPAVFAEAFRVLRLGGRFLCLEFSAVDMPGLDVLYKAYSSAVIPALGRIVAGDEAPYRYLVESISRFPRPALFSRMIEAAGFRRVTHRPLSGNIAAIHSAWKL